MIDWPWAGSIINPIANKLVYFLQSMSISSPDENRCPINVDRAQAIIRRCGCNVELG